MIKPRREDAPNVFVYLWWLAEGRIPGFRVVERRFWRAARAARHPRDWWAGWRKWRARPRIGDQVIDCRGEVHTVARFAAGEDSLVLEDGHACSWMSCCDAPGRGSR
jgi:hypothetical protein